MNFEQSIYPLTEFLSENGFSVTYREQHFISYSSKSTIITVAYAHLEYLYYTQEGLKEGTLVELIPKVVNDVFQDDRFLRQSTLTIENLISFFKSSGKSIITGDENIFMNLADYTKRQSAEFTRQINHLFNIEQAGKAWKLKDYVSFIKYIDLAEKDMLPESYFKKYKIAVDKTKRYKD